MADGKWVATTSIKHGEGDSTKWFQEGTYVAGLDDDTMASLVEAGAVVKEDELIEAKRHMAGISNSYDLTQLPDTPAGNAVRQALEKLRQEQADMAAAEEKAKVEEVNATPVADPNVPPLKASEASKPADTGQTPKK